MPVDAVKTANDALAFLLELAAFALWGVTVGPNLLSRLVLGHDRVPFSEGQLDGGRANGGGPPIGLR